MSNVDQTGVDSIRLRGMKVDELPIAESAITKQQMPMVYANDRENKIANIIAKYPKQTVDWVKGAIRECQDNIGRIRNLVTEQRKMINDYSGHISLCEHRDREISKLDLDKDAEEIKSLKLRYPPYNVGAMEQQITQCNEAIERSDRVIDEEHNSVSKLRELIQQCMLRDAELKPFGL